MHLHEIDGIAFHGDATACAHARGNIYTGVSNAHALALTARRRSCLERCVGADHFTAHTDVQVRELLKQRAGAAQDSR